MNKFLVVSLMFAASIFGQAQSKATDTQSSPDYSGMYTFLQEGEFVQLTIEDNGTVTGFVSRYKDAQGNDKTFVDHFFKQGRLTGKKLSFTTEIAQNISYEFKGTIERGQGKKSEEEAYYVVKGVLTQYKIEADKKVTSNSQAVTFESFPQDISQEAPK